MQRAAIKMLALVVALVMPVSLAHAGSYAATLEYHSSTPEPTFNGVINGTYTGSSSYYAGLSGRATADNGTGIHASAAGSGGDGMRARALGPGGFGVNGSALDYNGYGVYGYSQYSTAVYGYTTYGRDGIYGISPFTSNGRGVAGLADGDQGIGVFGHATSTNYGVLTTGVYGVTSGGKGAGVRGIALSGASINFGGYFESKSRIGYGVLGNATATSGANYGVLGRTSSPYGYGVYSDGNMRVLGNFTATGTKSAVVKVGQDDHVLLYAEESTENWFTDYGEGTLKGGRAIIHIDSTFKETVNTTNKYHVFLTPGGDCKGLYFTNKTTDTFEVREFGGGESDIAFSYRIVVKRKGYESERLARVSPPKDAILSKNVDAASPETTLVSASN